MGDFPRMDRRSIAGGCPADAWAEARLRQQERWLAERGAHLSWERPRQDQTRYASYDWRALWSGWLPIRQGLKRLIARLDVDVDYEGSGSAPPLEVRLSIQGVATVTGSLTPGASVRTLALELDEPLDIALPSAWVTLEFRSEVSDISQMLVGGSVPVTGTWTRYGEMTAITSSAPAPTPTFADRVLVALDGEGAAEVIEVTGPDFQISSPTAHRWPVYRLGTDSEHTLAVGWLTYFTLRACELLSEYEVIGADTVMIDYAPELIRPRIAIRGETVSAHEHNATGLYARAPQWRLLGLPGSRFSDGEETRRARWTPLRVQRDGTTQTESFTRTVELNRSGASLRLTLGLLGVYLPQPGRPRNRQIGTLIQSLTLTLTLRQWESGTLPTTIQSTDVSIRFPFLNPVGAGSPDLAHQLGQQLRSATVPLTANVNWRDGVATLEDLAQGELATLELVDLGVNPTLPLEIVVSAELDGALTTGGDPLDAWVVLTSFTLTCYGGIFNNGAPSSANKRLATRYLGSTPLETAIGRGIDSEDWSRWPDLNHLTWSRMGWVSEGLVGPVVISSATFIAPEEIARWVAIFDPQRAIGSDWRLRVQMYAVSVEIRISVTTSPGGVTTTYLLSNGSTPQWVAQVITLADSGRRIITLEIRTTDSEGVLYALSASEPAAAEGDL